MKIIKNEQIITPVSLDEEQREMLRSLCPVQTRLYNSMIESPDPARTVREQIEGGAPEELARGNLARYSEVLRQAPEKARTRANGRSGVLWLALGGKPVEELMLDNRIERLDRDTKLSDIRPVLTLPLTGEVEAGPECFAPGASVDYVALKDGYMVAGIHSEVDGVENPEEELTLRFCADGAWLGDTWLFPYDADEITRLQERIAEIRRPLDDLSFKGDRRALTEEARRLGARLEELREGYMRFVSDRIPLENIRVSSDTDPVFAALYGRDGFSRFVGILSGEEDG